MVKNDILYCTRINKDRHSDVDKGDIGYLTDEELPDIFCKCRISIRDVVTWEEYTESEKALFFHNKESKCRVYQEMGPTIIFLYDIDDLDKVMEEYLSRKALIIKSN